MALAALRRFREFWREANSSPIRDSDCGLLSTAKLPLLTLYAEFAPEIVTRSDGT
jgi:hypothetical protein